MMAKEEHWVERLLSPHVTVQEFSSHPQQFGSFLCDNKSKKKAKRVEEIYNILKFKDEQEMNISKNVAKQVAGAHERKCSANVPVCIKLSKAGGDTVACFGEAYLLSGIDENTNLFISKPKEKECMPRQKHKHCDEESDKMQLFILKSEISELKAKLQQRELDFQNVQRELLESRKKASCYAFYIEQSAKKDATIQALQEELHEKSKTVNKLNKDVYMEKKASANLQLQNKHLQQQLSELKQQNELRGLTFKETVKMQYNSQLNKLTNKVEAVKDAVHADYDHNIPNHSAYDIYRNSLS
ncbi:coiled-coil domain-containing protein 160-like [Lissotriton helveticus]